MPRRIKPVDNYPKQFFELVETAERVEEYFMPLEGSERATVNMKISFRSQLYCFFSAMRKEAEKWEKEERAWLERGHGDSKSRPMKPWAAVHVAFAKETAIRIEEAGIRLFSKTKTGVAEFIGRTLEKDGGIAQRKLEQEAEESQKRFMERMKNMGMEEDREPEVVMYDKVDTSKLPSDADILGEKK